ncbi:MAG: hypothetical protein HYV27_01650 [Candidatus Hydrogenedentes bacterium]|nr:hypothetical protein [Candidatus Hydrogenedentota bacterium]
MYQLLDHPRSPYVPAYMNVEYLESAGDFMIELIATLRRDRHMARSVNALWEGAKGMGHYLRNLASDIELGDLKVKLREETDIAKNWLDYGSRILELLAQEKFNALLIIDEFPFMVHHIAKRDKAELSRLLRWFRAARNAPGTRTRFLLGGSINLVSTLDELHLVDTINDLSSIPLLPFDADTAHKFIESAMEAREIAVSPATRRRIIDAIGSPVPYLLCVLMTALSDRHRLTGKAITPKMVEQVFSQELMGRAAPYFCHYYTRLAEYYNDTEARQAKAVLGHLSRADRPIARDNLYGIFLRATSEKPSTATTERFQALMLRLENDFYVTATDGHYHFSILAVQLWWKNNYGFQHS